METTLLFRNDPYMKVFHATVLSCEPQNNGFAVILDKTCFYPEGGGQPADFGTINGIKVFDVHDKNGVVTHFTEMPISVGKTVNCEIDWERRFNHMQHHSGEHVVSGIVNKLFGFDNVGFHMGSDVTVDFNGEMSQNDVMKVEELANEIIYNNFEIEESYPDSETLKTLNYRSKKELTGKIRIITVPQADCCACCGTHVKRSGEIGIIKLSSPTRYKGGVRISVLCGKRALFDYRQKEENNLKISHLLSAKAEETAIAVAHKCEEYEKLKLKISETQDRLFDFISSDITKNNLPIILFEPDLESKDCKKLCTAICNKSENACMILNGNDENGFRYILGIKKGDLREQGKLLNSQLNGKGGGAPTLLQGTFNSQKDNIIKTFNEIFRI